MKQLLLIVAYFIFFASWTLGQQQPQYTQYLANNYILNPALAGIENYTDVKISHRHQWVGIDGAPVTTYFTIQGPIGKKDDRVTATSFEMPDQNPRGRYFWQDYEAAKPHSGIGLKIINDRTGPLNRFAAYASYAYHVGIGPKTSLAAGFEAGFRDISLDRSKLDFGTGSPLDPAVYNSGEINQIKPDFGAGIWVYSADYFIGLSAQQIIPQKIYYSGTQVKLGGKLIPHLFVTGGYRFFLDDDISLLPSAMVKWVQPTPLQVDLNVKAQYRDLLWLGGGYRIGDGFSALVGINVSNTFNIGYSYDYSITPLNTFSRGSHEIILGFLIGNKYGDWCPRNVW